MSERATSAITGYHAHVYYDAATKSLAAEVASSPRSISRATDGSMLRRTASITLSTVAPGVVAAAIAHAVTAAQAMPRLLEVW